MSVYTEGEAAPSGRFNFHYVESATQSYDDWLGQNDLSGEAAHWAATPAGDGIANLLKYAFNLDPLRHESTGRYPGEYRGLPYLEPLSGGYLQQVYYRDLAKIDLRITPEWSPQLEGRWDGVLDRQLLGTQNGIEQWRARIPMDGGGGFMRVRVELE